MTFKLSLGQAIIFPVGISAILSPVIPWSFAFTLLTGLGAGLLTYTFFWSWIFPFYLSPMRHVPTIPGFPLWGHFFTIITTEMGVVQRDWHQKYGGVVRYFFPFGKELLSVVDDDALKQITVRNPYNYPKPIRAKLWMGPVLGNEGVLLAEGDEHIRQRKALSPAFSTQAINDVKPVFWRKGFALAQLWGQEITQSPTKKSESFEVLEWLNRTTLDIIGEAGFGHHVDSLTDPATSLREAYRLVFRFDLPSRIIFGLQCTQFAKYIPKKMNLRTGPTERIENTAASIVSSKKEKKNAAARDIMSLIMRDNEKVSSSSGDKLSFHTLRDQVMTFLGAGHDTTATGVAWTLHLLSKRPTIQSKLRAEIKAHMPSLFGPNAQTFGFENELSKYNVDALPYLSNVCRESLRYIPPIPLTIRKSKQDDTLAGHFIAAGTGVYIFANTINRLPQYWGEDADLFDPDRWDNLPETCTPNAYMSFLHGPRSCIGRKFAETEMKIIICCLLSAFEFRPCRGTDPESQKMWRVVLRPKDGIPLNVSPLA